MRSKVILNSTNSEKLDFEPEVEYLGDIKIALKISVVPCHSDRSHDMGINAEGVSVARLPRKYKKKKKELANVLGVQGWILRTIQVLSYHRKI